MQSNARLPKPIDLSTVTARQLNRIDTNIDFSGECWVWTAGRTKRGYGQLYIGSENDRTSRVVSVHRLVWQLAHPTHVFGSDDCVLHKCDNPPCVRPNHLFLGTHADNMRDMAGKNRTGYGRHPERYPHGDKHFSRSQPERLARGQSNGNAKVTEDIVRAIRTSGEMQHILADRHGLSQAAVSRIVRRATWRHVSPQAG